MPFNQFSVPDPTGSPNEKVQISRRTPTPRDFARFLLREGVDPDLAQKMGRAVESWRSEMHFEDVETLIDMEMWANSHTHPGGSGGGGGGAPVVSGQLYVAGAFNGSATVIRYEDDTDTWDSRTSMLTGRHYLPCTYHGGYVYAIGGYTGAAATAVVERLDVAANTWASVTSMGTAKFGHGAVTIGDLIYVIGGQGDGQSCSVYDTALNSWSAITSMPNRQDFRPVVVTDGNLIYVIGGSSDATVGNSFGLVQIYDPDTDSWSVGTSMPTSRSSPTGVCIGTDIYVVHGFSPAAANLKTLEKYDTLTDTWSSLTDHPLSGRVESFGAALEDKWIVAGGRASGTATSDVYQYDPSTDGWTALTSMAGARYASGACAVPV